MIKEGAKVLETDAVIFPMQFRRENQKTALSEATEKEIEVKEKPIRNKTEDRYARLKKSLRKRSVSIL